MNDAIVRFLSQASYGGSGKINLYDRIDFRDVVPREKKIHRMYRDIPKEKKELESIIRIWRFIWADK